MSFALADVSAAKDCTTTINLVFIANDYVVQCIRPVESRVWRRGVTFFKVDTCGIIAQGWPRRVIPTNNVATLCEGCMIRPALQVSLSTALFGR